MSEGSGASVRPGEVLAGKYRVERVLGEGGMGVVVAAHHIQLDQKVAIKFLLPEALSNAVAVARFAREARTAVRIQSEHVARVSDVGELPNGAPYMVMEYLEGSDLSTWLQRTGPLPIEQAVDFIVQACVAVADAHALRIVHRDLKPANLFCVRRSDGQLTIKVLDFGISKLNDAGSHAPAMTKTTAVMGTPLYMSPEQMRSSKVVDARADIWALGVILYELLTGSAPFQAASVMELALNIAQEPIPPLRSVRPDAPAGLEAIIGRCVEKDPERRYSNVGELTADLLPFAPPHARSLIDRVAGIVRSAGLPASPRPSVADIPPAAPSSPAVSAGASAGTLSSVQRTTSGGAGRTGPGPTVMIGGLAAAIAVLATGTWLVVRKPAPSAASAGAAASASANLLAAPEPPAAAPAPIPAPASTPAPPPAVTPAPPSLPADSPAAPHQLPAAPAAKTVTHRAAVNCDPPYTINAAGHRVHKPECP